MSDFKVHMTKTLRELAVLYLTFDEKYEKSPCLKLVVYQCSVRTNERFTFISNFELSFEYSTWHMEVANSDFSSKITSECESWQWPYVFFVSCL